MKRPGEVRQKLKQVVFRHTQRILKEALRASPTTCKFNLALRNKAKLEVQICDCKEADTLGMVCDESFVDLSPECEYREPIETKEEIKKRISALVKESSLGEVAQEFPDVAALLWVLSEEADSVEEDDVPDI